MFRTATIYQNTQATGAILKRLVPALNEAKFKECDKKSARSMGFVPPLPDSKEMTYETNGGVLFCLRTDEKAVPSKYVKAQVNASVAKREADGEEMSVVDIRLVKEAVVEKLLPGIPPEPSRTYAYIDKQLGMLIVDANEDQADNFMNALKTALKGIPFMLLGIQDDPSEIFTLWLKDPDSLGDWLELGDSCSLKHAKEGGTAVINIQHEELESDEMTAMLEAGKQCCRIGLVHEDATFAITAKLGLRKLTLGDDRKIEAEEDGKDIPAEFAVIVVVMRNLMAALEPLLGGWPKQELLDLHDEQEDAA